MQHTLSFWQKSLLSSISVVSCRALGQVNNLCNRVYVFVSVYLYFCICVFVFMYLYPPFQLWVLHPPVQLWSEVDAPLWTRIAGWRPRPAQAGRLGGSAGDQIRMFYQDDHDDFCVRWLLWSSPQAILSLEEFQSLAGKEFPEQQ